MRNCLSNTHMTEKTLIHCSDEILGGTPVFAGTRVPVQTLLDYLAEGDSLIEFLDDFPAVSRQHAVKVLEALENTTIGDFIRLGGIDDRSN
jgi:uncharacterized protein (DUF433 family)